MEPAKGKARIVRPDRGQLQWDLVDLEAWLPSDHPARVVWAFVETLDLSAFYECIEARDGGPGRPAADPAVLLALWLLATIDGVGSARAVDRLTHSHLAYRWIAGGVPVNYHGLADFRVVHGEALDALMSRSLAALLAEGLVALDELTVDGTRVRADAGRNSFRNRQGLERYEQRVRRRLAGLRAELESDPAAAAERRAAARRRADRDLSDRIDKARQALDRAEQDRQADAKRHRKRAAKAKPPESSSTDPEARKMRFADGSVAPGYNIQVAADPNGLILGVLATDRRADSGLASAMVSEVARRTGHRPRRLLVDTSYATVKDIAAFAALPEPVTVYMPLRPNKSNASAASVRKRNLLHSREPEAVRAWRARMVSDQGQQVYARRRRIERVNANLKAKGLGRLLVRGLAKVQATCLLHALAHNLMTAHRLRTA